MSKLKQHFLKHQFCYISLGLFLFLFHQMIIMPIASPIRCKMWEGKEVEIFLPPQEWRNLSGVNESLKDTEWIHYPITEGKTEKDPFFIKNQGVYQPEMYFNGNKHFLSSVNSKYPYLNKYTYINTTKLFGHNTFVLYDQKLQKIIVQYNEIEGYPKNPFFSGRFPCNENSILEADKLLKTYLH